MLDFKFFTKERVFSEYMDAMDDYFLGGIRQKPDCLSNREWNILPQDLKGGSIEDMLTFLEGFEASRMGRLTNPWVDIAKREMWNRGYMLYQFRTNATI